MLLPVADTGYDGWIEHEGPGHGVPTPDDDGGFMDEDTPDQHTTSAANSIPPGPPSEQPPAHAPMVPMTETVQGLPNMFQSR